MICELFLEFVVFSCRFCILNVWFILLISLLFCVKFRLIKVVVMVLFFVFLLIFCLCNKYDSVLVCGIVGLEKMVSDGLFEGLLICILVIMLFCVLLGLWIVVIVKYG